MLIKCFFNGAQTETERFQRKYESLLRSTLQRVIKTKNYPNSEISIYVTFLQREDEDLFVEVFNSVILMLLKMGILLERTCWGLKFYLKDEKLSFAHSKDSKRMKLIIDINEESFLYLENTDGLNECT